MPPSSSPLSSPLSFIPPQHHLAFLTLSVFFFFGVHNLLQEAILALPNSPSGIVLGFLEVLGVTVCTFVERALTLTVTERERKAPIKAFVLLTLCLLSSSSLSNLSLNFINYPTKVVFRSCKLIPTMLMATAINKKKYAPSQYTSALAASLGLVFYAAADWTSAPSFRPIGLLLVGLSVCADAVLPNAQEKLFTTGASRSEVTFYTNVLVLAAMSVSLLFTGDLVACYSFALESRLAATYLALYTAVSYAAITAHMTAIGKFGGVTTVVIGTARKAMTIFLSFAFFPKVFSWYYVAGTGLVLGGLFYSEMSKATEKAEEKARKKLGVEGEREGEKEGKYEGEEEEGSEVRGLLRQQQQGGGGGGGGGGEENPPQYKMDGKGKWTKSHGV